MIDRFSGKYAFLSNFHPSDVKYDGTVYPTIEHAFAAAKTLDEGLRQEIWEADTPGKAKRLGRKVTLRPGWDGGIKFTVMEELLRQKFADPMLAEKLKATHPHELVEGNTWGDVVWGACRGVGENHLGKLLMRVRSSLMDDEEQFDPAHLEWCRNHFASLADGGIWSVPRSMLTFMKKDDTLKYVNATVLTVEQVADLNLIMQHFEAAGVKVEADGIMANLL